MARSTVVIRMWDEIVSSVARPHLRQRGVDLDANLGGASADQVIARFRFVVAAFVCSLR